MEDRLTCLLALGGAGLAAWIASAVVSRPRFAALATGRDVHLRDGSQPIGRGGGMAVAVPVMVAAIVCGWPEIFSGSSIGSLLLAALGVSFLVGLIDDLRPLGPLVKFIGQCLAAGGLAIAVMWSGEGWAAVAVAVLLSLWSQNAWNFVDGTDGLMATAGIAVFAAGASLTWTATGGQPEIVMLSGLVVAGLLGFLPWNIPSARLFLGDAGSLFVGGAYAICTLMAFRTSPSLGWAWLVLAAPIHADVLICLARRVLRGCRWWEGHREHAYQHLVHRRGSHSAPLVVGGGLWLLVALPAAVWTLEVGWGAAVAGLTLCLLAAAAIGSGRPVIESEAGLPPASEGAVLPTALVEMDTRHANAPGLAMSRLGGVGRTRGELLVETRVVDRGAGAALTSSSLRK
ncbi:MAG: hypothetical protein ACO3SJ_06645 [Phycisphaerales bacterium]